MTLAEFLLARIAEDEAAALEAMGYESRASVSPAKSAAHYARWDPDRVHNECEAKRLIVERHRPIQHGGYVDCRTCREPYEGEAEAYPCDTLRLLALPYADRPGYRAEWRP